MMEPVAPFAFFMGGEKWSDVISITSVVFGANPTDDSNFPGYTPPAGYADPDDDSDSTICTPTTSMFTPQHAKPKSHGDYPLRQCQASGLWGAPHAMTCVDGRWYLVDFAPLPRAAKRYPARNTLAQ